MYNSIFLLSFLDKSRIIRGNFATTLSIGTIRTFITDSWRFVVTLSRYSICSLTEPVSPLPSSAAVAEIREFFAIISSLTKFIRLSSFSISTLTVLFTTGFAAGFADDCDGAAAGFATGAAAAAGAGAALGSGAAFGSSAGLFSTGFSGSAGLAGAAITYSEQNASSISDTLLTASLTSSAVLPEIKIRLNVSSNFSSSISCAVGDETMISPSFSNALNTRNALAAFNTQASST